MNSRTTVTVTSIRVDMRDEAERLVTYFIDLRWDGIYIQPFDNGEKAPPALLSWPALYAAAIKEAK